MSDDNWSGIHVVPSDEYHQPRLGVVSKGALDQVHRSPAHYKLWLDEPTEQTSAMAFGSAFHCAVLEPERFATEYVVAPDFGDLRTKKAKEARAEWQAGNLGRIHLSADDAAAIQAMANSVRSHAIASKLLAGGLVERTVRWVDAETGLRCQCRPDSYSERLKVAVDLKSAEDASESGFRRSVVNYRYHVQDALYSDGLRANDQPVDHFAFTVVEKRPPWLTVVYVLDADGTGRGMSAMRRDMETLAKCVKSNTFPGYPSGINTIELPPWAD